MRIDSHQHFWLYEAAEYPWIDDDKTLLKADYMPDDLAPLMAANGIDGTVGCAGAAKPARDRILAGTGR